MPRTTPHPVRSALSDDGLNRGSTQHSMSERMVRSAWTDRIGLIRRDCSRMTDNGPLRLELQLRRAVTVSATVFDGDPRASLNQLDYLCTADMLKQSRVSLGDAPHRTSNCSILLSAERS
jgi:hypothetical protein